MTQNGRYFRISFRRAMDGVRFSIFLVPVMGRSISDRNQLNPFCAKFWEPRLGWFFLRESLKDHPQNVIFGACGAKIQKQRVFIDMKKWPENHFFNYGIRYPRNFSASVCATTLLIFLMEFRALSELSNWASQQLGISASQLLSISDLVFLREPGRSL